MIDDNYGEQRTDAINQLVYTHDIFEKKFEKIKKNLLERPLNQASPIGINSQKVDIQKILSKLDDCVRDLQAEIFKIANTNFGEIGNFLEDDKDWIENRIHHAKDNVLNWFMAFNLRKRVPNKKLGDIFWLWENFYQLNLWMRYNKEAIFIECKDDGKLSYWYKANEDHLLSCFKDSFKTISLMRNTDEHYRTNPFAKKIVDKIKKVRRDPITDNEELFFNTYSLVTAMNTMITGMINSLEIFEDSVKISIEGGIEESEYPVKAGYDIQCPKCNKIFSNSFDPFEGSKIFCNKCGGGFIFTVEFMK